MGRPIVVRRGSKKTFSHLAPKIDGGQGQIVFVFEVMKEAALGDPGRMADVIDSRRRTALSADHVERRIEELGLGVVVQLRNHV